MFLLPGRGFAQGGTFFLFSSDLVWNEFQRFLKIKLKDFHGSMIM